jgi:hypothetical protein
MRTSCCAAPTSKARSGADSGSSASACPFSARRRRRSMELSIVGSQRWALDTQQIATVLGTRPEQECILQVEPAHVARRRVRFHHVRERQFEATAGEVQLGEDSLMALRAGCVHPRSTMKACVMAPLSYLCGTAARRTRRWRTRTRRAAFSPWRPPCPPPCRPHTS